VADWPSHRPSSPPHLLPPSPNTTSSSCPAGPGRPRGPPWGADPRPGPRESSVPVDVARQRELKWLEMFAHWDKWLSRRYQKVKLRCRKGIPSSLRAKAWQLLSNSKELLERNPGRFEELERQPGDPKWLDVIEKDLHRQFPFHEMFAARGGHG
uniref:Rab-GAP TBC domain-containing protein n=1 Tax=Apteryx owenii TaxID=8824 RepID=A0A8B9P939_APTOW